MKAEVCVATSNGVKIWARDNVGGGICLYKNSEGKPYAEKLVSSWLPPFITADKAHRKRLIREQLTEFAAKYPYKPDTDANMTLDVATLYTDAQPAVEILRLFHDDKFAPNAAAAVLIGEAKGNSEGISAVPASVVIDTKRVALRNGVKDPWLAEPYMQYTEHGYAPGEEPCRKRKRSKSPSPTSTAQREWDYLYANSLTPKMAEVHMKIQSLVDSLCTKAVTH